jgi:hypothetical protein
MNEFDAAALRRELGELDRLGERFGTTMVKAFAGAAAGGRSFGDVLKSLMLSMSRQSLNSALQPVGTLVGGAVSSLIDGGMMGGPGAGGQGRPLNMTVNISALDASSLQRSETQVASMLTRAVDRGMRNL